MRKIKIIILFLLCTLCVQAQVEEYFDILGHGFKFSKEYKIDPVKGEVPDFVYTLHKVAFTITEALIFDVSGCESRGLYGCQFTLYRLTDSESIEVNINEINCGIGNDRSFQNLLLPGKYFMECIALTRKFTEIYPNNNSFFVLKMALSNMEEPEPENPDPEVPDPEVPDVKPESEPEPDRGSVVEPEQVAGVPYSQNYIRVQKRLTSDGNESLDEIQYFDGLGRQVQSVQQGIISDKSDLIIHQEYDSADRLRKQWLPIVVCSANAGGYSPNIPDSAFSQYADKRPFSVTRYEESPLERVKVQHGAGEDWEGKPLSTNYFTNNPSATLHCSYYCVDRENRLRQMEDYATGELLVNRSVDEDGNRTYTFTNAKEQLILQRQMDDSVAHDTYYVYDDFDNLCYVLPPMINDNISQENLDLYAYRYKYDDRNRCIEKKLPGCAPVKYVFDYADHLIFSQDGNQAEKNEWMFILYDALGRETVKGLCHTSLLPEVGDWVVVSERAVNSGILNSGYAFGDLNLIPQSLLTVNYYDDYSFLEMSDVMEHKASLSYGFETGVSAMDYGEKYACVLNPAQSAKGQLTGTRMFISGSDKQIITAMYYDTNNNLIQSRSTNHLGGYEKSFFAHTFTGKVLRHLHIHSILGKPVQKVLYTYEYDHAERMIKVKHQLNNGSAVILAENSYDELGRLKDKKWHNAKDSLEYAYNIRNWVTDINGDKFTQHLHYTDGIGIPCYNGNISSMTWKSGAEKTTRGYVFVYDGLNRLTNSAYGESESVNTNTGRYNERVGAYDKQGNILSLQRYGKIGSNTYGLIDNLSLTYAGNQLKSVKDIANNSVYGDGFDFKDGAVDVDVKYTYDKNGNLSKDLSNKILGITYNSLNLPLEVQFENGNITENLYTADGVKCQASHKAGNSTVTTDYCGNVIYENGVLSKILTEEGYITLSGAIPAYHYFLQDHQGNNRVVVGQNGTVEEVNHYYPFGGLFGEGVALVDQPYKYNGKELDRTNGLDWYDYGARHYDAVLGRFPTMDRYSEKYYSQSPYHYAANNPIKYIDLKGDSTAVFLAGGTVGHVAILSQNKEGKWQYYSFNGVPWNKWSLGYLGKKDDDKGVESWNSVEEFLASIYVVTDKNTNADEDVGYEYTEGYVLPTSSEQDDQIQQGAKETMDKGYDLDGNNCADAVRNGLGRAGIKLNKLEKSSPEIPYLKKKVTISVSTPNHIFNQVKKVPNGRYIKIQ